ncbi:hypothetical protein K4K57_011913 [Colletotrichum sp. SAR 10_99]|nr:hypothetical protein K4K57_011913 [Colletotrichum sp. SAR 10_99]
MKPNKRFTTDEDCLYVNIFAPSNATPDSKLPVMYFIQGGGFQSLSNANFNGSDLARFGNMLVVQVNYRVGPYGFLQSKEVQAGASMNNGLKDQIQGLKWLKQHAAAFGGNPDQMVAVGDSAGATSVAMLLAAFGDNDPGLIKGAIMESVSVATVRTLEQGQEQYNCLTNATGCNKQPDSLACLRGLDAKALQTENCQFNPNLDGDLVKAPTLQRFAEGKYLKVPTIAGTCTDEGTKNVPQSTDTIEDALKTINNQATQSLSNASLTVLQQTYLDVQQPVFPKSGKLWRQLATAHGDFRAHCITKIFQDAQARDGVKTFNYRYGPIDDEQEALGFGAYHTVELNGVFGPNNTDGAPPKSYSTTNAPIVPLTQAYWASFVKTLDPNAAKIQAGMPEWQAWTADGKQRLLFQNNTGTMEGMPTAQQDNCAMLAPMIPFIETPATDAQKATVELKKVNSQAAPPAAPPAPPKAAFIVDVARMMAEADNEEHKKNNGTAKGGKKGKGEDKSSTPITQYARRVGLVDNDEAVPVRELFFKTLHYFLQRRNVSVHTIDSLHSDEDVSCALPHGLAFFTTGQFRQNLAQASTRALASCCLVPQPISICVFDRMDRIVGEGDLPPSPAHLHPIVHAGVDQLIVNDDVSGLRDATEKPNICIKARVEE